MSSITILKTHKAVVSVAKGASLELLTIETPHPKSNEVLVKVSYVACTPLNLHRADGGLFVKYPQIHDGAFVGTVIAIGPNVTTGLKPNDEVFGFTWRSKEEMPWQEYVLGPENLMGKVPDGFKDVEALATVPDSFVTAWHTTRTVLGLQIPWPKSAAWKPSDADVPILVWGGSGSVGMFVLPLLKWAGYTNVISTASSKHHNLLKSLGATKTIDYREKDLVQNLRDAAGPNGFKYVVDCIGSANGSVKPISEAVGNGASVAIMLPVIIRDSAKGIEPIITMEVDGSEFGVQWKQGVKAVGVRTHFYLEDKFNAEHLQPTVMPALIASGDIKPTPYIEVKGKEILERGSKALDLLRDKAVSGQRLIWKAD